ncbi:immunoglobulin superfamily DCC subclass member 3-like isoform X2 [Oscarella lobularis]|uniref:immunoglobulin superfamily DCC subclass member 3-like isoform X2 n=1 Tax=Oscarella lobularis TaxID=121494 RepID=UPI0033142DB8
MDYILLLMIYVAVQRLGGATVRLALTSNPLPTPGQNATFLCSVTGSGTIIRWEKDNTVLNLTNPRYVSTQKLSSLDILSLVKTDSGMYQCVAMVSGIEESDFFYLDVLVNPEISYKPLTVATEGESVTLGCPCQYFTKMSWTFNGVNVSYKPGYSLNQEKTNLTINRVSRVHAGQYVCTAVNYNQHYTATGTPSLVVYYAATAVLRGSVNGTAIEGDDVNFYCNASGLPTPRIEWKKNDMLVSELGSSRYEIRLDGKVLSISSVQTSDTSNYTCSVYNSVGGTSKFLRLTVEGPPSPPKLLKANITINANSIRMYVNWTVPFNGNSAIKGYTLHYRQKGDAFWHIMLVHSSQVSATVPIPINLSDLRDFEFYVTAANRHGSSEESAILQVSANSFIVVATPSSSSEPTEKEKEGFSDSDIVIVVAVSDDSVGLFIIHVSQMERYKYFGSDLPYQNLRLQAKPKQ